MLDDGANQSIPSLPEGEDSSTPPIATLEDAPVKLIDERKNEIQRLVMARQLLEQLETDTVRSSAEQPALHNGHREQADARNTQSVDASVSIADPQQSLSLEGNIETASSNGLSPVASSLPDTKKNGNLSQNPDHLAILEDALVTSIDERKSEIQQLVMAQQLLEHLEEETLELTVEQPASLNGHSQQLVTAQQLLEDLEKETLEHKEDQALVEPAAYDLAVLIPAKNGPDDRMPLFLTLQEALDGLRVEVFCIDVREDDTGSDTEGVLVALDTPRFHVHVGRCQPGNARTGGLTTALVHGMDRVQATYVAVIDADLQHQPEQLRLLYDQAVAQNADLVVANRSIKGESDRRLDGVGRRIIATGLKWTIRMLLPEQLLRISDPLSDFFLLRRSLLDDVSLRPFGNNILLEILIRCRWRQVLEVPYHVQIHTYGQSKADKHEGTLVLQQIKRLWREVPAAGRLWKIGILFLLNVLITLVVFKVMGSFPWIWANLNIGVFGLMACLDFVLFNRFILPSPTVASKVTPSVPFLLSTKNREGIGLPSTKPDAASADDVIRKHQPAPEKAFSKKFLSVAAAVVVIVAVCWISYAPPGLLGVLAVLFIGLAVVSTKNVSRDQAITMVLAIAVGVATIDYLSWRLTATNWHGWWISVPLLCAEVFGAIHILGFQFSVWPWPPPEIERGEDPTTHPIFIFIPTVNEGPSILRPTLEGCLAARHKYLAQYPHGRVTIVVCNDGRVAKAANWEEIDALAQELGVCCVTRAKGGGAKAGNIENARQELQVTGDALLVIFDADQVAKPDFLLKTIPPFLDPKMGWVQTGQYYANLNNPVSRWADDQQSMFYNLLCPGKAALNAAFICGTNVVIRAAALDEIGGLPQDSVTEDFAASIALHPSWRSVYLTDVLVTGLGPLNIPSYLKQQGRWALGTLGVFRTHWREILLPQKHGLRFGQRVQYFLACTHYLCGLRDLIYLLSPILFIYTGIPAVRSVYLSDYLWHFLPYCLLSAIALWYSARGVTGLRGIIIGFGSFPVLIGSLLSVILQRKVGFAVTSKQRGAKRSLGHLWVYVFLFLVCVVCLFWATQVKGQEQTSLFISVMWVVYSMLMLGTFLWLNFKDMRFHEAAQRSGSTDEVVAKQLYPPKLLGRNRGLNPVWNLGLAVLLAAPILGCDALNSLPIFAGGPSTPFVISQEKLTAPYFGVSLPIQLLKNRPLVLERDLGTQFSIIGRTQDIHDLFDVAWADQLAAHHARPWITLQFGVFGPHQKPPLAANLPAIINGLHDPEIRRWAVAIRDYGKPVYLTILQHADRNWSLSSGVANGGIPEDVSKAWIHVQSIFHEVGANNVAWVWAPADPLHDQPYAPPASTIDAVLQSFINYPGTKWGDPETILQELVGRYPTKPIFVEASVDGPAAQKAAWLTKLGQAVNDIPQVYALLYHEGGPALDPSSAQIESWSLASDPDSLAAMRRILISLHRKRRVIL